MSLSHDIISEFVKVTNNNKEKPKEGTVYATIVQGSDGKYVKIDGSDLLTPAVTTTDIEDGERVTVMIKDHKATVTGNVTSPSASGNRVDKVVDTVTEQIGVFETVVADKVSTNELEAYKATIEYLVAGKAEIEDLEAINATIENLKVKDAEIENAVIDKATIEDLEAVNAKIENLKVKDAEIENAVVENLEATKADIQILNADFAQIKTLVSGNLTSDNILSFNITADKVTMEDAFIKDAMIANVNAAKINAGRINTNSVVIGSEDGGMSISGATQQFTDKNGNVRIQIGRDASDDFTFALYGEDGRGQLINQNGITASAISDGIIVNDMISDDASISGGKLDISSVITEINNDGSTTIKSNKIHLDGQNQSLEVAFNSLKSQVDTIQDVTIDGDLTSVVEQVQSNTSKIEVNASSINTLIAEDKVIKKQVTDLEGNIVETNNELSSKYASLNQNLEGFKTTVANTYATKSSVNDVKNNLESNYSTTSNMNSAIEQKVDEISASVSSTYATKNEVKTIDDNIKANYSTTEQMESAISVAKNEINLGISQIYETKTEVTNKIGDAINKVQIGGRNVLVGTATSKSINVNTETSYSIFDPYTTHNKQTLQELGFKVGDKITVSFDWSITQNSTLSMVYGNARLELKGIDSSGSDNVYVGLIKNPIITFSPSNRSGKIEASHIITSSSIKAHSIRIRIDNSVLTFTVTKFKIEKGDKATDWSPAPEDIETTVSNLTQRVSTAESKITDTAITNVVKQNFYTKTETNNQITSKGYQTASQVQQTVDSLKLKFTQSGGYNLFLNSGFLKGTSYWGTYMYNNPTNGSIETLSSSATWGFPDSTVNCIQIRLSNQSDKEYGITQAVKTTIGKKYTLSFYYAGHRLNRINAIIRTSSNGWLINKYIDTLPNGGNTNISNWGKCTLTFTADAKSHNINIVIVSAANDGYLWVAKPMVVEGELDLPYSPNPNEIYDGITEINKDGVTVRSNNNAYTNFNSAGMNSFNNSGQQTLGIRNGGITFHPYNTTQLGAYVTQSALWSGSVAANGLAISTTNNGTYISLGISSLSDTNTSLNMDQALTISASDGFQPRGINFWKDVHAHGYGIRQLAHLQLAGSAPIQFDYLNTSPSTIYETTSNGHSLYVMGGYQMHLGCMDGTGAPKGVIWMQNSTNTHSYTHWNFHNYTMYNMKTATSYANTLTNRYIETYGINSNVDGIRYLYRNIELVDGVGIRNLPNGYKGCPYDIVSIVCKGRGHAWVECEDEYRFIINGDCKSVNVEIIIYPTDGVMTMSSLAPDESPTLEAIPERNIGEQPVIITNEGSISVESEQE